MISTGVRLEEIVGAKDMTDATSVAAAPPLRSVLSTSGVAPTTILSSVGPVLDPAVPNVAVPAVADVAVPGVGLPGVMADLALMVSAACPGELSGVSAERALRVVEAVEAAQALAPANPQRPQHHWPAHRDEDTPRPNQSQHTTETAATIDDNPPPPF